jgi:2-succinyl-6-hydroxy-2,4-cyclohexadiene-1-carboxylate synthase
VTPSPFHLPRRIVATGGALTLAVAELGAGPPLLVLHGFTGCAESMLPVARPLAAVARVLLPDLPGHGRTGRGSGRSPTGACTMPATVDALVAVLDACGIGRADVLGYSMGGRVALHLAVARSDRVGRVVTIGASPGLDDPAARRARVVADEALAARLRSAGIAAFVDEWEAQPLFAGQAALPAAERAAIRAQRLAADPEGLACSLEGMGTGAMAPLGAALGALTVPCLFVAGADDTKFAAVAEELAALVPDGRVALVAGAGHAAHVEAPAAVVELVRAFLAGESA